MTASSPHDLMEQGQAFVRSLAVKIHRSCPAGVDLEDLIAYGEVGLAEAARDFDPQLGCQFSTFAYYRIRGAIYDGLAKMSGLSRARYRRLRYERAANEVLLADADGKDTPRSDKAAGPADSSAAWFANVTGKLAIVHFVSRGETPGGGIRDSTVPDPDMAPAANIAALREVFQRLRELVDQLPDMERKLITHVYFEDVTLQESANRLGISKSWASRLHARVLEKLAASLSRLGASE